ncbi:ribose transport system ATP-binding protein (plasmid) [Ketogulonicigenium robustum]|uniref:Ribose transport system ATP-binding protein n=1 Tax=Ketogulonicigenium robustum TaxID=92947 RepID=A0A1W6P3N0_9RHOB|nr:sugar ABC transporter ATP-binding protein [Ketogulonicigenium robustum]ARO15947.1 ribose transport system ATP-binding protein [Ketogulonicigenium robustum]
MTPSNAPPLIEAKSLTKSFGAVRALTDGSLSVAVGQIHALMGANGCGKSTLCKSIAGTVLSDGGVLQLDGQDTKIAGPRDAEDRGIALFYQELSLIPQRSVAENVYLGHEPRKGGFVDRKALRTQTAALIALFDGVAGDGLTPDATVGDLPPDQRQIVEILKVFAKSPRLMIMDEATAALDGRQAARFFQILQDRKAQGVSTIMISHRLDEVFAVCDHITVMRNGKTVAATATADTTRDEVVHHMVGEVAAPPPRAPRSYDTVTLTVTNGTNARLRGVNFSAHRGEILGLAGLQGQGQSALLQGLFGALPFTAGSIEHKGKTLPVRTPAHAVHAGFAYISGDRGRDAAFAGRSIFENLVAATTVRERKTLISPRQLRPRMAEAAASLRTKYAGPDAAIGTLSGGNQQKIFIARWLATSPDVLLLDDPTKGIDLGAKADLFALMRAQADAGATILFYSSEDAEILDYADRVLVFNGGQISAELTGGDINAVNLARAAFGDAT